MIEVKNITKIYKTGDMEFQALNNVSFTITDGEFVAIMGPSGSGKSTLMHILGALDSPTSGTYLLDRKDVSVLPDDELADIRRNKIGFVFQAFNLLPRTSVLRNVMLPLVYAGVQGGKRMEKAKEALFAAGMDEEHFHHMSNQISGGKIQRVGIARALVNNPSLMLADDWFFLTARTTLLGLAQAPRYAFSAGLRARPLPSFYVVAEGETAFFPQVDGSLVRGVAFGVGIGVDFQR